MVWWAIRLVVLMLIPFSAMAQSPASTSSDQQLLKSEELDGLVAPIALYPDTLLAQVLIASSYPLEVVQAERWATTNKNLKGDRLKAEVDKQAWDESVKSLVATPSVLTMMSTKLDWTQKLGDAVLAQQPDVMDAIQRLRSRAQANNKLTSTKEQKVTVKQEQNRQVIAIEPTSSDTLYVPYYDLPSSMAPGRIPTTRRTTITHPAITPEGCSRPALHSGRDMPSDDGRAGIIGAEASTGVEVGTTSISTAALMSSTGSTIRSIGRECDTATTACVSNSGTTICARGVKHAQIFVAGVASRCSNPAVIAAVSEIAGEAVAIVGAGSGAPPPVR
jgi:hypothetical protein